MSTKKFEGFWYVRHSEFALITGRGCDSPVGGAGDLIISVNGRRGRTVCDDLEKPGVKVLEVVCADTARIRRITIKPGANAGPPPPLGDRMAYHWVLDGVFRRAISKGPCLKPNALDVANQSLLSQRRTLARHLLGALRESRALRAELGEAQNRAAATALKLGAEIFDGEAIASDLRDQLDAMEQERNQLRLQLEESRLTNDRLIARLSKQSRTRRVTHIRIGNELFRNRTGARA